MHRVRVLDELILLLGLDDRFAEFQRHGNAAKRRVLLHVRGAQGIAGRRDEAALEHGLGFHAEERGLENDEVGELAGLEGDLAAMEFRTRAPVDVESFYLVSPPRIVIDIRAKR